MIIKCGADNVGNEDRQTDKTYSEVDHKNQDLYIMEHELLQFFELDLGRQNY